MAKLTIEELSNDARVDTILTRGPAGRMRRIGAIATALEEMQVRQFEVNLLASSVDGSCVVLAIPSPVAFAVLFQAALHDRGARRMMIACLVTAVSANARNGIIHGELGLHEARSHESSP